MFSLTRRRVAAILGSLVVVGLLVGLAVSVWLGSDPDGAREPVGEIRIAAEADPAAAFGEMSAVVGFKVSPPSYLPQGSRVSGLTAGGYLRRTPAVQVFVTGDTGGLLLSYLRSPLTDLEGWEPALLGQTSTAKVWILRQSDGAMYYVAKGDQAFTIALRASSKLTDQELAKVVDGLR